MNKKGNGYAIAGGILVIVIILFSTLFHFWLGPKIFLKQVDVANDIIDKTYTAENSIYNYEWFKSQYEDIQAQERMIENTKEQLNIFKEMYGSPTEWDFQTKGDYSQLNTVFLGQKNFYEDLVADYNARSNMDNRNIFKDKLPFDVDKKIW